MFSFRGDTTLKAGDHLMITSHGQISIGRFKSPGEGSSVEAVKIRGRDSIRLFSVSKEHPLFIPDAVAVLMAGSAGLDFDAFEMQQKEENPDIKVWIYQLKEKEA